MNDNMVCNLRTQVHVTTLCLIMVQFVTSVDGEGALGAVVLQTYSSLRKNRLPADGVSISLRFPGIKSVLQASQVCTFTSGISAEVPGELGS